MQIDSWASKIRSAPIGELILYTINFETLEYSTESWVGEAFQWYEEITKCQMSRNYRSKGGLRSWEGNLQRTKPSSWEIMNSTPIAVKPVFHWFRWSVCGRQMCSLVYLRGLGGGAGSVSGSRSNFWRQFLMLGIVWLPNSSSYGSV